MSGKQWFYDFLLGRFHSILPTCLKELRHRGFSGNDYTARTEKSPVDSEGRSTVTGKDSAKAEARAKCPWAPEGRLSRGGTSGDVSREEGF